MAEDDDIGATIAINVAICFGIIATIICFCVISLALLALLVGGILGMVYIDSLFIIMVVVIGLALAVFVMAYSFGCCFGWLVAVIGVNSGDPFGGDD